MLTGGEVSADGGDTVHQFKNTGTSVLGFNATIAGDIDGDGNLIWNGHGTLTLAGQNTYSGATTVATGSTLIINGNNSGAGVVTVAGGAAVGGIGTLGGDLDFDGEALLQIVDLNNPLTVDGNVTFGSGFGIANLSGVDWDGVGLATYTILDTTQSFSADDIDNFGAANAVAVGENGREAYFTSSGLNLVVIPEPGTVGLLGLFGVALVVRRRLRK